MAKRQLKGSDIWVLVGILLVVYGVWKLAERLLSPWWGSLSRLLAAVAGIAWPVAIIVVGLLVIYAVRKGRLHVTGKRLMRSSTDRRIAGVCGGIADYFGIDAVFVRVTWVVLLFASFGTALLIYFICWAIIPETYQSGTWM